MNKLNKEPLNKSKIISDSQDATFLVTEFMTRGILALDKDESTLHVRDGGNFKLNEFSALLGLLELDRFQIRFERRRQIAKRYNDNLKDSSWKVLYPLPPSISSHYKTIIMAPISREEVREHLNKNNIKLTGGVYNTPLHMQPVLKKQFINIQLPVTDYFSTQHICPPCYPELTFEEVDYITEQMIKLCP